MLMRTNMNREKTNTVEAILRNYFRYRFPEEVEDEIREWLAGEVHVREKDVALKGIWDDFEAKPDQKTMAALEKMQERLGFSKTEKVRPRLGRRIGWKVAAVMVPVALAVAAGFWYNSTRVETPVEPEMAFVSVETPEGTRRTMVLADNSKVWVNSGTTISYAEEFTDRREVRLQGEAYFVVEKDAEKPFVVQAGEVAVQVFGTSFNVNAYPDRGETVVTLDEGSVEVGVADRKVLLEPGKQAVYDHATHAIVVEDAPDRLSWHLATLDFDYSTLKDIFRSLEVIYGVTIDSRNPIREDEYFSVQFVEDESLLEVLSVLQIMTDRFTYRMEGKRVIINYR